MTKEIRLNAFDMNCVGHIQHGMWTHPRDRSTAYNTIEYWQDLARLAERGKFDGIFLADIVGVYDVYRGGPAPSIIDAVQIPVNDPMMVVPVMAAVTEHIGFGVTANLTYEPPYLFARRMSTLDHLTRGRIGWNIVTGYLDSAARGMGLAAQPNHDGRYDAADEYMSVVYKLWEASWEDGAVLRDKSNRVFADPTKIHRVRHRGRHYQVDAIHLAEPSLQRTPVLYQAGSSARGREFAATHAECVFVFGADKLITRDIVADIRARAAAHGRDPREILIFYNRAAVVGRTRREAEEKYREYHEHVSIEGALAHFSSSTGIDFSRYEPDEPIRYVKNDAINSAVETLTTRSAEPWTLRRIIDRMGLGSRNPAIVGSAEEVADDLIAWVEETDIDGFNLSRIVTPESLEDFVNLVVPILQERGAYKHDYLPGTLREKLFGGARLLPPSHPAATHRQLFNPERGNRPMADTPTYGRYAEIPYDRMTPEQQEGYRSLIETRGALGGPTRIWVHNPKLVKAAGPLSAHFHPGVYSLSEREGEIACCIINSKWHSAYPTAAHERRGNEVGLPADKVEALLSGRPTSFTDTREQIVYEIATCLSNSRWASKGLFDRAVEALGHVGITDVIILMGYYTSVSMTLAFYDVPAGAPGMAR